MAYRFNPPPNWPIDDPSWTPPPGWQPDPSWGPAPEGWNFWIAAEDAPAAEPADEQQGAAHSGEAAGDPELERTHVAQQPEQPVSTDAAAGQQGATGQGQEQGSTGQYGALSPYGPAPTTDGAADAQTSPAPEAQAPAPAQQPAAAEDDATHVAGTGETAQGSPETAEYSGPDREADLAQQAPYESAAPAAPTYDRQQVGDDSAHGQQAAAPQGYDQATPAAQGAQGYGQASPADYGAQGYDQPAPAPGYDQGAPAAGYGQASPAPGHAQGSPADYGAQGYGQGSPSGDPGAAWPVSTGAEPPKKGVFQRFWWVGCIILLVLALVIAIIGGVILLNRGGDEPTSGGAATTQEETSDGEQTTDEETTDDEAGEPQPTPTDLATIDASAEEVDIVGSDGAGTMAVHMTYTPAEELKNEYGEPVEAGEQGDYLVVTAKLTVTEGTFEGLNPFQFAVKTPYGGAVDPAGASYSLKGSGVGFTPENGFSTGDEYTMTMLFDVKRAGDNTLEFDSYSDTYTWDVPA